MVSKNTKASSKKTTRAKSPAKKSSSRTTNVTVAKKPATAKKTAASKSTTAKKTGAAKSTRATATKKTTAPKKTGATKKTAVKKTSPSKAKSTGKSASKSTRPTAAKKTTAPKKTSATKKTAVKKTSPSKAKSTSRAGTRAASAPKTMEKPQQEGRFGDAIRVPGKIIDKRIVYRTGTGHVVSVTYLNEQGKEEQTLFTVNDSGILNHKDMRARVDSLGNAPRQSAGAQSQSILPTRVGAATVAHANVNRQQNSGDILNIDNALKVSLVGVAIVFAVSLVAILTQVA